jgi:multidrug efflux pump subunit AcrB
MDRAYSDVKMSMDGIANRLPSDSRTPIVMAMDISARPTMTLSISSDTKEDLLYYVEEEIVPQLDRLSSVSNAEISGGREDYIRVEIKEDMLREYGITVSSVISALSAVNFTAPLGTADFGDVNLSVRTQVKHETLRELGRIPITLRTGDVIRLSDVANIDIVAKDAVSISRYNGNENISLNIQKPQAVSAGRVSRDVMRVLNNIAANDSELSITIVNDDSESISASINSVAQTLILAILLSMLILFLFLGDIRACLIVGSSMPTSLLVTFIFMNFMGFSLNVISMSGLIIGVGMMVDNAIVVIDSCFKSKAEKKTFAEAAVEGTKFVMLSIFAVTMTTVVVFLPLATIQGMAGQMFAPLGFSIVFALIASLLSAITLVPLFFFQFKPIERKNALAARFFKKTENGYAKLLKVVLRKKKTVVVITAAIMVLSIFLASRINFELMPTTDDGIISIAVETRPGLKLEYIDAILVEIEEIVEAHPDVERFILTSAGGSGLLGGGGGGATLTAYLHSNRRMKTSEVMEQWQFDTRHILDCDIIISAAGSSGMGFGGGGIQVMLEADNLDNIREASALLEDMMNEHPDIIRVSSTIERASPQAEIVIDPLMAASRGLTPQMITAGVFTALNGSDVTDISIDNRHYSVRVEYPHGRYESVSDVANMMIMSATGALVPLADISSIKFTDTPQTIMRQNGQYTVTVTGTPTETARFSAEREILSGANDLVLPGGVSIGQNTMAEIRGEEFSSLGMAIIIAILLVFMVMAIQFESVRHSLMVMTCIPLAVIGSFLLMFLTGATINMVSLLGFLVLIGLVVNNGILFVDTTNRYRKDMELHEALIHAGRTRLRPILMITLTTVLAMMPLALGIGDAEIMQGLGVTVIGGLTASTILALIFLPTFYLIIDGNPDKRAERKRKREEKREKVLLKQELRHELASETEVAQEPEL